MKKLTSKVVYLWQFGFFFSAAPTAQNSPEIEYPFYRFLYPMIGGTICGGGSCGIDVMFTLRSLSPIKLDLVNLNDLNSLQ